MRAVCNAVQSKIPPTHPLAGVSDGGRAENTEGLGHHVGIGSPALILCQRGSIGEGRVIPLPRTNSRPGRRQCLSSAEPDKEGLGDMGSSGASPPGG
jgi:hypothetical protein